MSEISTAAVADETLVTEITLQPDGRVYVFGASREVLAILAELQPHDARLLTLLSFATRPVGNGDPPP